MKKQGTGIRDQGLEGIASLLRQALPPLGDEDGSPRDLWPAMQRRMRAESAPPATIWVRALNVPWFDWALGAALAALLLMFPAWIPVVLYYL